MTEIIIKEIDLISSESPFKFKSVRVGAGRHSIGLGYTELEALEDMLANEYLHIDCEECKEEKQE